MGNWLKIDWVESRKQIPGIISFILLFIVFVFVSTWWDQRSKAKKSCVTVCAPYAVATWDYKKCQCNKQIFEVPNH